MANSIALAENYLPILDEIYKASSKSAILDTPNEFIRFIHANKVELFKLEMSGLGNYNRNTGYPTGDVTGAWEALTLSKDRGQSFMVDAMDDNQTINMAFGRLVAEFMRTQVVPEVDAIRFSTYAANAGNTASANITVGTTDVPALIDVAEQTMGDAEVPEEGRILFVSETCYAGLKAKITRILSNENTVNRLIEMYDDMRVIKVPAGRFTTSITLSATDGYTAGSTAINFMIVHPSAVAQVVKHEVPRIFNPLENQAANAWKFDYRIYHDAFVLDNKEDGIYVHTGA